jgi:hypothetical protein
MLLLLALAAPALAAAAPLMGTFAGKGVGREVKFNHGGKQRNDWAGVLRLKLDDGPTVPVFCIQIDVRVTAGDRYKSDGPVLALPNGCQIRYLLDKYPASSARTPDEAAARQMAIWVFSDGVAPAAIADTTVRDRVIALVNEAKKGACPDRRTEPPELTIQPPVASAAAGQAIAYTVRAGPADAGQSVTLTVAAPAALANAQKQPVGQEMQVVLDAQGSATFYVISAAAGQTLVRARLPYRLEAGTVFSHADEGRPTQRLVIAGKQDLAANASARASWAGGAPPQQPPEEKPREQPREQPPAQPVVPEINSDVLDKIAEQSEESAPPPAPAQPAPEQPAPEQPAAPPAGAAPRPSRLPNTSEPGDTTAPLLAVVALLIAGGLLLRRATPRR